MRRLCRPLARLAFSTPRLRGLLHPAALSFVVLTEGLQAEHAATLLGLIRLLGAAPAPPAPSERPSLVAVPERGRRAGVWFKNPRCGECTRRPGRRSSTARDMVHWARFGEEPVVDNGKGISGDPQVVRMGDLWVMFYFGAGWKPGAFDTFATSYDLVHWTKWTGDDLIAPSEPWDKTYAHKPWMLEHDGVVYHFYCAVGTEGRVIALATSKVLHDASETAR